MSAQTTRINPFFWHSGVNPLKLKLLDQWALGDSAVDIGCGNGAYAQHLRSRGFSVIAIDQQDRLQNNDGIQFMIATVPPIPLPDKSCDTVLLYDVLEHIQNESELLAEIYRVARKRLILSVPSDNDGMLPKYGLCLQHHIDKTHQREYDSERLKGVLSEHGFEVLHVRPQFAGAAPLVVEIFFTSSIAASILRRITRFWLKGLQRCGFIRVDLPSDWFAVAEIQSKAISVGQLEV